MSFIYLEFLNIRLSLNPSFFFQYIWLLRMGLHLSQSSIKPNFQHFELLSIYLRMI